MQQHRGRAFAPPAEGEGGLEVVHRQPRGPRRQIDDVAGVERDLHAGHRRHRDFEDLARRRAPPVGTDRAPPVAERAVQGFPLPALLSGQGARPEVIGARQRAQERREGRGVVEIAAPRQDFERHRRQAEPRPPESHRAASRGALDALLRPLELRLDLRLPVPVQPRLVVEGVVADLVSGRRDGRERLPVHCERGVLPHDEHRDGQVQRLQQPEDAGHHQVQVRRQGLPLPVPAGLQVRPLVVEVEGQAREGLARRHGRGAVIRTSARRTRAPRSSRASAAPPPGP